MRVRPSLCALLDAKPVVHDLDEEVVRAKDVPVGGGRRDSLVVLTG